MHRGGGNARITSHNQGFNLIETFNNLAPWGEKKFVSELKRTSKFQRGVYCHTEDNSPKYRMVGNDVWLESPTNRSFKFWYRDFCSSLRANAKQSRETVITRSYKRRSNLIQNEKDEIATFRCTPLAMTEKRLRNKCAMTCFEENILSLGGESGCLNEVNYNHERGLKHELINNGPSPEFISSSQLTKKFNPLTKREGNNFIDTVFSRFTSHHSLKQAGATHVALCDSVGSYYRHWCGAFTLAEVLITLGIIGVVAAMTLPTLIESHNRQVVETRLEKFYSTINQAIVRAEVDFGDRSDWYQDTNNIETDENGKLINGSSGVEKWWNTYLAPYVKTVGIDYDNGLPVFKFADGSCLKANQATAMRDWIYYTTSRDRCIKMAGSEENSRGVCSFSFMYVPTADSPYFYKKGFEPYKSGWNGTESGLYNACKKSDNKMDKSLCGALIQYNGWKIPKNYPLKVKY